jgi:hypothetical protein
MAKVSTLAAAPLNSRMVWEKNGTTAWVDITRCRRLGPPKTVVKIWWTWRARRE